ncbi:MAG: hypothetical protein EA397_13130 [Deltaproteobacteria bacterium]|nr:MAG: hypothetical protein EA397_13130 [Deltaproteobacteria bacterium]
MIGILLSLLTHACEPGALDALQSSLGAIDRAWVEMDGEALDRGFEKVKAALHDQCTPLTPALSLRVHQAYARHAYTVFDTQTSVRAWLAVRDLAPEWTENLDEDVPPDHPVREAWSSRPGWKSRIDEAPPGGWVVDGTPGDQVPKDRAFVLQALGRDGQVTWSSWLSHTNEVPTSPWRSQRIKRLRGRGSVVSLGVGVAGASLLGAGLITRGQLSTADPSELRRIQTRANTLGGLGIGGLVLSGVSMGILWGVKW